MPSIATTSEPCTTASRASAMRHRGTVVGTRGAGRVARHQPDARGHRGRRRVREGGDARVRAQGEPEPGVTTPGLSFTTRITAVIRMALMVLDEELLKGLG